MFLDEVVQGHVAPNSSILIMFCFYPVLGLCDFLGPLVSPEQVSLSHCLMICRARILQ